MPLCSTPGAEPITDLSVAYPAGRAYVLCCHNLHVFDLQGAHLATLFMGGWAQGAPAADLRAFSWPLPNSSRVAVHLDATGVVRCQRPGLGWGLPAPAAARLCWSLHRGGMSVQQAARAHGWQLSHPLS